MATFFRPTPKPSANTVNLVGVMGRAIAPVPKGVPEIFKFYEAACERKAVQLTTLIGRLQAQRGRRDVYRSSDRAMHVQSIHGDALPGGMLRAGGRNRKRRRLHAVASVR